MSTFEWLQELCPEIAEWQIEIIAEHIEHVRSSERETIAKMFDGNVWAYDYREIAAAIRAQK